MIYYTHSPSQDGRLPLPVCSQCASVVLTTPSVEDKIGPLSGRGNQGSVPLSLIQWVISNQLSPLPRLSHGQQTAQSQWRKEQKTWRHYGFIDSALQKERGEGELVYLGENLPINF